MNRILYTVTQCKLMFFILILGFVSPTQAERTYSIESDENIENRILSLPSAVEARYSKEVKKRIQQYVVKQRKMSEILIGRSALYFPTFESILKEKGLPLDLKYLSVVESGLRPQATSRAGAAGLWQFMRPTGRMMGLKINRTIDERRDVEKSTRAAAEYLLQLYESFDDWTLAIAAYNCGPGNMRKAIRKAGGKRNYWDVQKYLPRETREYVPKFIAINYVMNYYYEHDLQPELLGEKLTNTSTARVFEAINLKKLSKELEIEIEVVKTLNPSYVRNYIPKSETGKHNLVLPTPEMRIVADKYHVAAALPLLKKEVKEEVLVVQTPRMEINMEQIPNATYLRKKQDNKSPFIKSITKRAVRYGDNEEEEDLLIQPESFKINNREKSVLHYFSLIKKLGIKT